MKAPASPGFLFSSSSTKGLSEAYQRKGLDAGRKYTGVGRGDRGGRRAYLDYRILKSFKIRNKLLEIIIDNISNNNILKNKLEKILN
jgi:hypothetical protein